MELGKVTKQPDGYQVKFERTLAHPIEKVWDALTKVDLLKLWFTDIEMDFKPGGKVTIRFHDEEKTITYGEIITIQPPHLFAFTWEGELATWELHPQGKDKCRLTLTYSRISDEYAVNVPAGFHTLLDQLEDMLSGKTEFPPFGKENDSPDHKNLKERYATAIYRDYPDLEKEKSVVVEKTFNATQEKVWEALTRKEQMKQWYFDLTDFKPEVGFEFKFAGEGRKGEKYMHLCKVTEVIPNKRLQYSWTYEHLPGYSLVTFELAEEGNKTKLTLTHKGLETFPQDSDDFTKESFTGGWKELIKKSLLEYLEKTQGVKI